MLEITVNIPTEILGIYKFLARCKGEQLEYYLAYVIGKYGPEPDQKILKKLEKLAKDNTKYPLSNVIRPGKGRRSKDQYSQVKLLATSDKYKTVKGMAVLATLVKKKNETYSQAATRILRKILEKKKNLLVEEILRDYILDEPKGSKTATLNVEKLVELIEITLKRGRYPQIEITYRNDGMYGPYYVARWRRDSRFKHGRTLYLGKAGIEKIEVGILLGVDKVIRDAGNFWARIVDDTDSKQARKRWRGMIRRWAAQWLAKRIVYAQDPSVLWQIWWDAAALAANEGPPDGPVNFKEVQKVLEKLKQKEQEGQKGQKYIEIERKIEELEKEISKLEKEIKKLRKELDLISRRRNSSL